MSNNIRARIVFPIAFALVLGTFTLYWFETRSNDSLAACARESNDDLRIECIFDIVETEMRRGGVAAAMEIFSRAYVAYPSFANGGCHARAHRVGDIAYYGLYLQGGLDAVDFPQETTACGYGFYHGFMEHLIQDNPDPEFITATCDRLVADLADRMADIQTICYHGAGHGLVLAHLERMHKSEWGNVSTFVSWPAKECTKLTKARESDIEQCYEGTYNVLVDAMALDQYGFHYNKEKPFAVCAQEPAHLQNACIYEMAQKLDSLSRSDPKKMITIVSALPREQDRVLAFGVGMAGIIQQIVATEGGYETVLASCDDIAEPYYTQCVKSIAWGLFEHGEPQREYKKALALCAQPSIQERNAARLCYERVAQKLPRFYDPQMIARICKEFPSEYQSLCLS